jgi:hypothetical protein
MKDAPRDGRQIIAHVRNTHREIRVHWNGHYWDEGNGEKWDEEQLIAWEPVTGMYTAHSCSCRNAECKHWYVTQMPNSQTAILTEIQARMVAHLLNFLDDTIANDDFLQKLDHVRSTGEWPKY